MRSRVQRLLKPLTSVLAAILPSSHHDGRGRTFSRLWQLAKPFSGLLTLGIALSALSAVIFLLQPLIVRQTLQHIFGGVQEGGDADSKTGSGMLESMVLGQKQPRNDESQHAYSDSEQPSGRPNDGGSAAWDTSSDSEAAAASALLFNCVLLLINYCAVHGFRQMALYQLSIVGDRVVARLRGRLLRKLLSLGCMQVEAIGQGVAMSLLQEDSLQIRNIFRNNVKALLNGTLFVFGGLCLCLYISPHLSAIIAVLVLPLGLIAKLVESKTKQAVNRVQVETGEAMDCAFDAVQSIRVVEAFGTAGYECDRFEEALNRQVTVAKEASIVVHGLKALMGVATGGILVSVVWGGGSAALSGKLSAGDLIAFVYYAVEIQEHARNLLDTLTEVTMAMGACQRVLLLLEAQTPAQLQDALEQLGVINVPPTIEPGLGASSVETLSLTAKDSAPTFTNLSQHTPMIRFSDVSFTYRSRKPGGKDVSVLRGVSLDVFKGQTVALVGPSGGGKSTLINLIMRFIDPTSGNVNVAGLDTMCWNKQQLRSHIGWVNQTPRLVSGTVLDNIRYGSTATVDECMKAAQIAGADEFVLKLPEGYYQKLGRGSTLSGGQQARLCLARALVRLPRILLLDEVSAALDAVTEERMTAALRRYTLAQGDVTSIFVAHRLSTVCHADVIFVVDNGQIAARGTHGQLYRSSPLYKDMCDKQGLQP